MADKLHPSHVTRVSLDASSYDEICINCGATDFIGGWGNLAKPCKAQTTAEIADKPTPRAKGGQ